MLVLRVEHSATKMGPYRNDSTGGGWAIGWGTHKRLYHEERCPIPSREKHPDALCAMSLLREHPEQYPRCGFATGWQCVRWFGVRHLREFAQHGFVFGLYEADAPCYVLQRQVVFASRAAKRLGALGISTSTIAAMAGATDAHSLAGRWEGFQALETS